MSLEGYPGIYVPQGKTILSSFFRTFETNVNLFNENGRKNETKRFYTVAYLFPDSLLQVILSR
jgi:hypothetical protein